uniref:Alpha/beta hydrolase family protein n=1 Tax=Megaviridae environmental sample TaxID=1737588 RepID=A0A5J6VML9_9VIRU|nr:MAG: hypothetical protein [Megaviridae environmental sample]
MSLKKSDHIGKLIEKCNNVNGSTKGINTSEDNVDDIASISYFEVQPKFHLLEYTIGINLVHFKLNEKSEKTLVVIPGFSESSTCWTIGRINKYKGQIEAKGYSNIYIFDLKEIKDVEKLGQIYKFGQEFTNDVYNNIAKIIDKIIRALILKNKTEKISVMGRSAGGGVTIFLYELDTVNYIDGLNLVCPGYDKTGIKETFLSKAKQNKLKVILSWSSKDEKIPYNPEGLRMTNKLRTLEENFDYIEITNTKTTRPEENHRIHPEAVDALV